MMRLRRPCLAAALFTSVAVVGLMPALAQPTPPPANSSAAQSEAHHHAMQRMLPGQLVDGRIAFLKTELKITPAQETQWQQVAGAMHENANSLDQAIKTARQDRGSMDAVQRLALREQFAKVRAEKTRVFSRRSSRPTRASHRSSSKWPTNWLRRTTNGITAPEPWQ